MPARSVKKPAEANPAKDSVAQADAWVKESSEKLRDAVVKATEDLRVAGSAAIEGEIRFNTKFLKTSGDLLNARLAATLSVLKAQSIAEAVDIEQSYARDAVEALAGATRELSELRVEIAKETSEPFSTRAREYFDNLKSA